MVDTSAGGLLVSEDIIRPMVDTSAGELLVPEDINWADNILWD
jgi:hypothetical protein